MTGAGVRHVVVFTWKAGTTDEQVRAVKAALERLPAAIPEIAAYHVGTDAGINQGNADFAVVADFASVDDYLLYRDHPEHQRLIAEHIRPIVEHRAALQLRVPVTR